MDAEVPKLWYTFFIIHTSIIKIERQIYLLIPFKFFRPLNRNVGLKVFSSAYITNLAFL